MNRDDCREAIGAPFESFVRYENESTDAFDTVGLFLVYDRNEQLVFIEAVPPAVVTFRGVALFGGRTMPELVTTLRQLGLAPRLDDVGCEYRDHGFGIYAPDGQRVEAVSVFSKSYYADTP